MPNIYHELLIAAPAEKVFNAITTQEGLASWWTPKATATPELESIARFPFGEQYYKEMKIVEMESSTSLKWDCIAGASEWVGTNLTFKLHLVDKNNVLNNHPEVQGQMEQQENFEKGTLLVFQHNDWKDQTPMFAECNYTWAHFLRSLKLFCETGKGLPWPNQHRVVL